MVDIAILIILGYVTFLLLMYTVEPYMRWIIRVLER